MAPEPPGIHEPPVGMDVHVDHDGVDWRAAHGVAALRALFGTFALIALALASVLAVNGRLGAAGLLALGGLFLLGLAARQRGQLVVLRPDRIWIGAPPAREEILFDDLERVRVSLPDSKRPSLVLESREGRFVIGLGAPEEHLRWFAAAIEQARHHDARTDQVDGHELFFHRDTPEAFEKGPSAAEKSRSARSASGSDPEAGSQRRRRRRE